MNHAIHISIRISKVNGLSIKIVITGVLDYANTFLCRNIVTRYANVHNS